MRLDHSTSIPTLNHLYINIIKFEYKLNEKNIYKFYHLNELFSRFME